MNENELIDEYSDITDKGVALLKEKLETLDYEEKLTLVADILCNEWYLEDHHKYIKSVLVAFAESLK